MGGADQRPFESDLAEPTEEELPEASGLLYLAEDGLDDLLSQAITAASAGAAEAVGHGGQK